MIDKIDIFIKELNVLAVNNSQELEQFRINYLGKKGIITQLFSDFKNVPVEQKKELGAKINLLKNLVEQKYHSLKEQFSSTEQNAVIADPFLPGDPFPAGSRHPVSLVRNTIIDIFTRIGFVISEGPEIEDDYHVFTALNFPFDHPARDMQDTFFIEKNPDILLRTHTSSVQVRVMESCKVPIRTISPGRVYRNEDISARSHCFFHQIEGLYIDENVSFADLKQTLLYFARELFGEKTQIRMRPSFFPFTEPSAEVDISCNLCGGKGCNICKYSGWIEIMGCGMVDPNVLKASNIDPEKYSGFAFGMGIERIALNLYQINDIRLLSENDVRFLRQFYNV